jgi:hypothetical protein
MLFDSNLNKKIMSDKNKKDDSDLTPEERLQRENEIKKLKLSAFNDAHFSESDDLPPEVENEWLNHIEAFEEQYENVDQITVAERLDHPDFPSVDELSEDEIPEKLDEIMELMYQNSITLDAVAEVSDEELYRFIVEELFLHKMDDFDIEGMMTSFIYEEFHPNARLDIEMVIEHFFFEMFSKDFRDHLSTSLAETCESQNGETMTQDEAVKKALAFGDCYEQLNMNAVSDFEIEVSEDEKEAEAHFLVDYQIESTSEITSLEGEGEAKLRVGELGYWDIYALSIPGFEL